MSRVVELLHQFLVLPGISADTLQQIEQICELKTFETNEIIYREHENSRLLYFVVSGQVDVQYLLKDGRRKTLDTCLTGDLLLWSAVTEPHETNSIGICRAHSELLAIDGQKLLKICDQDTQFGFRMMSLIASVIRRRLQAARQQLSTSDE
ncbi:MAG: Crp/Fnr family transcriptional regulator [Thermoguttaceae bacterium]|nr:Crp/Fnr family transcriptional regulator [Thermoguttaceae bacterium]